MAATPSNAGPGAHAEPHAPNVVYVREIVGADVMDDARRAGVTVAPDAVLYAVHAADGTRLAVLDDRDAAYAAARDNDYDPVSVH